MAIYVLLKEEANGKHTVCVSEETYSMIWKEVTRDQAESFYKTFCESLTDVSWNEKLDYFNNNRIKGGHVLLDGKVETIEEQKERIFQNCKNRLTKEVRDASKNECLRFLVIEYLCQFTKIDPFVMAASIANDGITILYDDSSISSAENKKKEKKVNKLISKA